MHEIKKDKSGDDSAAHVHYVKQYELFQPSSSCTLGIPRENPQYGVPLNYFPGQTPLG